VFCGGEKKAATAAAVWRQGNLLHFGFEQSPDELNAIGRRLLLNSIAYISRFTEDKPIAITPSVFAGPAALPRTYARFPPKSSAAPHAPLGTEAFTPASSLLTPKMGSMSSVKPTR